MATLTSTVPISYIFHNSSALSFFPDASKGLSFTIDTETLHIRSVESTEEEYERYAQLMGDEEGMKKSAFGQTKTKTEVQKLISDVWTRQLRDNDPYTGIAVFNKSNILLGHVTWNHGEFPGQATIDIFFHNAYWEASYIPEAIKATVKEFALATKNTGYLLGGVKLETIQAKARADNQSLCNALERIGMRCIHQEEINGAFIKLYSTTVSKLERT